MISTLTTNSVQNLIRRCKELPQGETNRQIRVFICGLVRSRKSDFDALPLFFHLVEETEPEHSILVRWVPDPNIPLPRNQRESFDWVNKNLEKDCMVEVGGFLRHTRNGKPMLDAFTVTLVSHSSDSEDLEETREMDEEYISGSESDEDYVPETDSDEDDEEDFRKNVDLVFSKKVTINQDVALTEDYLIFHGNRFEILAFRTKPGRITIKSSLGNFHFDRMDELITSVLVPATDFEPSLKSGYTTLVRVPFRKILEVLF